MSNEIVLSGDQIALVNFMRNEANLDVQSIAAHQAWIGGLTERKRNFELARGILPDNGMVDVKIAGIDHEIAERQTQIHYATQSLGTYTVAIANLITGKTDPKDVIDGAANDIRQYNLVLGQ